DGAIKTLAQDEAGMGNLQIVMKSRAGCALHAMIRPQHLWSVGHGDRVVGRSPRMRGCKRQVSGRMPILREHDIAKVFREPVEHCYDFMALRYRKCAAGTEVVLYIDNDEHIAVADRISRGQFCLLVFLP